MFFWFVGTAVLTVWFVFRDPAFDHRLLIVGAVLPVVVDGALGGARVLHSVVVSVTVLTVLMLATPSRSPVRRRLLGLPIGLLLHLVFTGAWADTSTFWWPFTGLGFDGAPHPIAGRGWWNIPLEAAGIAICWWIVRRARLVDVERRTSFVRSGRLALAGDAATPGRHARPG